MNYLYQKAYIYRAVDSKLNNIPFITTTKDTLIDVYDCRISRSSVQTIKGEPNITIKAQLRAYFNIDSDIRNGDRLECDGSQYNIIFVYKPGNHHIEADLEMTGDI